MWRSAGYSITLRLSEVHCVEVSWLQYNLKISEVRCVEVSWLQYNLKIV